MTLLTDFVVVTGFVVVTDFVVLTDFVVVTGASREPLTAVTWSDNLTEISTNRTAMQLSLLPTVLRETPTWPWFR